MLSVFNLQQDKRTKQKRLKWKKQPMLQQPLTQQTLKPKNKLNQASQALCIFRAKQV